MLFQKRRYSLPEAYEIYVSNPSEESQNLFLRSCFCYDFGSYESDMKEIKRLRHCRGSSITKNREFVLSNGSSGGECRYCIGPNGSQLIDKVESFQRGIKTKSLLKISTLYPEKKEFNKVVNEKYIVVDFSSSNCAKFIAGFFEENPQKTHVEVSPNVFMMMCCHKALLEELRNRGVSVTTTGDDAYKTKDFSSRDRMIDWKTGCNFHECERGGKHILPIWFEEHGLSHNVLNLDGCFRPPVDDILEARSFSDCGCGLKKCELRLVSHFRNKPKSGFGYFDHKEIFGRLKGKYLNFQLVFQGSKARLLTDEFCKEGESKCEFQEDYEMTRTLLGEAGFSTTVEKKKYAYLGRRKRPLMWVDKGEMVIEQF